MTFQPKSRHSLHGPEADLLAVSYGWSADVKQLRGDGLAPRIRRLLLYPAIHMTGWDARRLRREAAGRTAPGESSEET